MIQLSIKFRTLLITIVINQIVSKIQTQDIKRHQHPFLKKIALSKDMLDLIQENRIPAVNTLVNTTINYGITTVGQNIKSRQHKQIRQAPLKDISEDYYLSMSKQSLLKPPLAATFTVAPSVDELIKVAASSAITEYQKPLINVAYDEAERTLHDNVKIIYVPTASATNPISTTKMSSAHVTSRAAVETPLNEEDPGGKTPILIRSIFGHNRFKFKKKPNENREVGDPTIITDNIFSPADMLQQPFTVGAQSTSQITSIVTKRESTTTLTTLSTSVSAVTSSTEINTQPETVLSRGVEISTAYIETNSTTASTTAQTSIPTHAVTQSSGVRDALELLKQEVSELKKGVMTRNATKEGMPCNIAGRWVSKAAGVAFNITTSQGVDVRVPVDQDYSISISEGFFGTVDWIVYATMPFARIHLFTVNAIHESNLHVATFTGECRTCEQQDKIVGHWFIMQNASSCESLNIQGELIGDIWKRR